MITETETETETKTNVFHNIPFCFFAISPKQMYDGSSAHTAEIQPLALLGILLFEKYLTLYFNIQYSRMNSTRRIFKN